MTTLLLLDGDGAAEVAAEVDGDALWLTPEALLTATGWDPKPYGLCRGDVCLPLRDAEATRRDGAVDLVRVAAALRRPMARSEPEDGLDRLVAVLGEAATSAASAGDEPPPLVLQDLDGRPVSVDGAKRRKQLLLSWASW